MQSENRQVLIDINGIEKYFFSQKVLENLNLKIYENEILVIFGKSGSGKSTLLKILLGFYPPNSGNILLGGKNLLSKPKIIRSIVGYVSQENSFYEKLSVKENLKFFGKLYGVKSREIEQRINYLLSLVKLDYAKDILAENISGGMKRRLEFAISLIHNPKILILDEPFTGIDIELREELWRVIENIKKSSVTVVISTHLINSAGRHCDRAVILSNKKIISEIDLTNIPASYDLEKYFLDEVRNK